MKPSLMFCSPPRARRGCRSSARSSRRCGSSAWPARHRHRRQPDVAGRPYRRSLRTRPVPRPLRPTSTPCWTSAPPSALELVVPTIDDELVPVRTGAERFESRGIRVAVSPVRPAASATTNIRRRSRSGRAASRWPTYVSARRAAGLRRHFRCSSSRGRDAEASGRFGLERAPARLLPRLRRRSHRAGVRWSGPEFTIDVLCDVSGKPSSIARERVVIRSVSSTAGAPSATAVITDLAHSVVRALPFFGAVNIQCRVVAGRPVMFRNQPAFFRRHSAHHRGRRRLSRGCSSS